MRKPIGKFKRADLAKRSRRKLSIRKKISGTADRPRVCVTKSNKNLFVQVIDDVEGKTLATAQTFGKKADAPKSNKEGAKVVGTKLAEKLSAKGLKTVVFDRNGNAYAGVLAAVAEGLRENGIQV